MMPSRRLVPVVALALLAGAQGVVADPGTWRELPPVPVGGAVDTSPANFASLADLVAWALAHRPESEAVWRAAQVAAAQLDAANAADWPTLSAQFAFTQSRALTSSGSTVPTLNRYGPSLSFVWTLYDFGARAASQDAQRWRALAAAYAANRQLQAVVAEVETAWFAWNSARAGVAAQTESVAALDAALAATRARFDGGLATRGDTLRAEAARAEAGIALQGAERDAALAGNALKRAAAIDQTRTLTVDASPAPPPDVAPALLDELVTEAERRRPDLAALLAGADAARADADKAEAARRPTFALNANTGRTLFLESDRSPSTTYSVGVSVSVPLVDGGRLRAEARAARELAAQRDAEAAVRRADVAREVADARADVVYAQQKRSGVATQFAAADEAAKSADARYRTGLGSLLELLTAQADLARARQARAAADGDWLAAFSRLNQALGRAPASTP